MRSKAIIIAAMSLLTLVAACPKKGGYLKTGPTPALSHAAR